MLSTLFFFFGFFNAAYGSNQRLLSVTDRICSVKTFLFMLIIVMAVVALAMSFYPREQPQTSTGVEEDEEKEVMVFYGMNRKDIIIYFIVGVVGIFGLISASIVVYSCLRPHSAGNSVSVAVVPPQPDAPLTHDSIDQAYTNDDAQNSMRFNVVEYEKQEFADNCPICLDRCEGAVTRLECGHEAHSNCISPWLYTQPNCPVCRREVSLTSQSPQDSQNPRDHMDNIPI